MNCLYEKCGIEIVREPGDQYNGPYCCPAHRWMAAQPKLDLEKPLVNYVGWKKKPIAPVDLDEH